jgi:hypothetical protein
MEKKTGKTELDKINPNLGRKNGCQKISTAKK